MITTELGYKRESKKLTFRSADKVSENFYEISKRKSKITECYPIHCGLTVLHYSKRILMDFVLFLYEFLEEQSFELVYSGKSSYLNI